MNGSINAEQKLFSYAKLLEAQNIQASDNSVSFNAVIQVTVYSLVEQSIKSIEQVNDLAHQKMGDIQYTDLICSTTQEFDLQNEVELPNNIGAVVQVESDAILTDVETNTDMITMRGKICTNLIYTTNEEKPKLKNQKFSLDFTQEVLCNSVIPTDTSIATLEDCCTTYEIQGELSSTKGVLILKNAMRTNAFAYRQNVLTAVVDTFCPQYELHSSTSSFVTQKQKFENVFNEKIDGNIVLAEDSARIDRVLATMSSLVVTNSNIVEDGIQATGTMYTNVVYQLDDDTGSIGSVLAELPFDIILKVDEISKEDEVNLSVAITEIEARNKRAKEIDILADVSFFVTINEDDTNAILSDISLGDLRTTDVSAMGIYFVNEANDIWDIAKYLLVSPEEILKQNPTLEFPINKPTKVTLYREQKIGE